MSEQGTTRTRLRAAAVGVAVTAVLGGLLAASPAHAATPAAGCGLAGVSLTAGGLTIGALGCSTGAAPAPDPTPSTTAQPVHDPVARSIPTSEPTPEATAPVDADLPTTTSTPAEPAPAPTATPEPVATTVSAPVRPMMDLDLDRSSPSVYPIHDGYRDTVRFALHGLDADGHVVPVTGSAVLRHAGRTVKRWTFSGTRSVLTWDGRVAHRVRTGVYTLAVTAWTADGVRRSATSRVRVVGKQLEHREITVRQNVGSRSGAAALPKRVAAAFAVGPVSVRIRTDATVRGPAELVFTNDGHTRSLRLRDGVHVTKAFPLFRGFERVRIDHRWAKGAARLHSLKAVWSYSVLR